MYALKTFCNERTDEVGKFEHLWEAKLCAALSLHMFMEKFSTMEEFKIIDESNSKCYAIGMTTGFKIGVEVIEVGA